MEDANEEVTAKFALKLKCAIRANSRSNTLTLFLLNKMKVYPITVTWVKPVESQH